MKLGKSKGIEDMPCDVCHNSIRKCTKFATIVPDSTRWAAYLVAGFFVPV